MIYITPSQSVLSLCHYHQQKIQKQSKMKPYLARPILVYQGFGGVPILFGNYLPRSYLPHTKGFMKF